MLDRYPLPIIVVIQLALLFLPDPRGEFPINDDWAYAHSVQWLLSEHRVRLSDWVAMNLLPQTLLGGAASALLGYSLSALRHVTQIASLGVVCALWQWFSVAGVARRDAVIASLTVMAVPCWPILADSYMTDVYGMLFALPSAMLFLRALRAPSAGRLAIATVLAVAGVLQRQIVLVVPFAFLVAWLATRKPWRASTLAIGVGPLVVGLCAAFAYRLYLELGPGVPGGQTYIQGRVLSAVLLLLRNENRYAEWVALNAATIAGYLGLFAAPWALWQGALLRRGQRWGLVLAVAVAILSVATGWLPPYREHQLLDAAGIGPQLLYDTARGTPPTLDRTPGLLWRIGAIPAAYGLVALVVLLGSQVHRLAAVTSQDHGARIYLVTLVAAYIAPFILTDYSDRYFVFVLPFLLPLIGRDPNEPIFIAVRFVAVTWTALALAWSIAATHDYFAWNRARWDAIHLAEGLGGTPETIDGGFEYNAYYRFEREPGVTAAGKSWWWIADDRYAVAFSVPPGFVERKRFEVRRWLNRTPPTVYLVERKPG